MILQYDYNEDGDIVNATGRFGARKAFSYDQNGWIERIEDYNSDQQFKLSTEYNISSNGRVKMFVFPKNTSNILVHDHLGHVVSVATNDGLPEMTVELPYGRRRVVGDEVSCVSTLCKYNFSN